MTDEEVEEFLAHYGVLGQKWGVRRGKRSTGVSRRRGIILDRNTRTRAAIKDARSGKRYQRSAAAGRRVLGAEQQNANWKKLLKDLNAQDRRIKSGKVTVSDRIEVFGSANVLDLVVSRTRQPA